MPAIGTMRWFVKAFWPMLRAMVNPPEHSIVSETRSAYEIFDTLCDDPRMREHFRESCRAHYREEVVPVEE